MAGNGFKGARAWSSVIADKYGLACGIQARDDSSDFHSIPLGVWAGITVPAVVVNGFR